MLGMACTQQCGDTASRWFVLRVEGPEGKHAISYRCRSCGHQRLQLGGVEDLAASVHAISEIYLRRHAVGHVDREEFGAYLLAESWKLWLRWMPDKGVPFAAYLFRFLPLRANEFYRSSLGRTGNKMVIPIGLPGDVAERAVGADQRTVSGDPSLRRSPDLSRLLAR